MLALLEAWAPHMRYPLTRATPITKRDLCPSLEPTLTCKGFTHKWPQSAPTTKRTLGLV